MRYSLEIMQIAMRVLKALTDKEPPDPKDVDELRKFGQTSNGRDLDELACDVIKTALKRRQQMRKAVGS